MNKHFEFVNDGYWSSNGCDCCEDDWMDVYNCISHENLPSCVASWDIEHTIYTYLTGKCSWEEYDSDVETWVVDTHVRNYLEQNNITWGVYASE